eukprot:403347014
MRIVIQRVLRAQLTSNEQVVSTINKGLMVLVGITHTDNYLDYEYLAKKILNLKLWPDLKDPNKAWGSNVIENKFDILLVSQFTLYHQLKGTKPDFHDAMNGEKAQLLYNEFLEYLRKQYEAERVQPGAFGQYMNIEMVCDGPVTITVESQKDEKALKKLEALERRKLKGAAQSNNQTVNGQKEQIKSSVESQDQSQQIIDQNMQSQNSQISQEESKISIQEEEEKKSQ